MCIIPTLHFVSEIIGPENGSPSIFLYHREWQAFALQSHVRFLSCLTILFNYIGSGWFHPGSSHSGVITPALSTIPSTNATATPSITRSGGVALVHRKSNGSEKVPHIFRCIYNCFQILIIIFIFFVLQHLGLLVSVNLTAILPVCFFIILFIH